MHLHRSNRSEQLIHLLSEVVRRPLGSPFRQETIVVQSKGMERWISLELSRRLGIWSNCRFPFPRSFVDELLRAVLEEPEGISLPWDRERLFWSVARVLQDQASHPAFSSLTRYAGTGGSSTPVIELAQRIADAFDQYAVFRPEVVLAWEAGAEDHWQAVLWRALVEQIGRGHLAARSQAFFERWSTLQAPPASLPERISVFGISSLPPVYLRILARLAEKVELHLFQLTPSRHYVADLRTPRELSRERQKHGGESLDSLHLEQGNPLFASMAREARDFQRVLLEEADCVEDEDDLFRSSGTDTLLHGIQTDVLELIHRGQDPAHPPFILPEIDASISIHACHGPWREVEVLRDQLRALFDSENKLRPEEVVVMTPDMERYAPLIQAAFELDPDDPLFVPYRLTDRTRRAVNPGARALGQLVQLFQERVSASRVLDLLALPVIRDRFAIDETELPIISNWVREAGVRWGVDADDRTAEGQPEFEENTWRFGLRRLLLGHAMPGKEREIYTGVLPYDDLEGAETEPLGKLAELCDVLFQARTRLRAPRPLEEWGTTLTELLDQLLLFPDQQSSDLQEILDVLHSLVEGAKAAGFATPVELELLSRMLLERLDNERSTHDFLAGGVTFCAMLPMRSIPFRVICLLGMNDGAFPRSRQPPSFDLISAQPKVGDRSIRDEDRHLFLDALLSARERLIITYVGRSLKDDSALPPSVVVSELLDVLDESFTTETERAASQQCLVVHPLQPFSRRYFDGSDARLFGFDGEAAAGAQALVSTRLSLGPFLERPLPEEPRDRVIRLEDLGRCLENPARALLRDRLGLVLEERPELVSDREPLELGGLERYTLGTDVLARAIEGEPPDLIWPVLRARGVLPLGTAGRRAFASVVPEVKRILEVGAFYAAGEPLEALAVDEALAGSRLVGALTNLWPAAQLDRVYARVKAKTELSAWVRHLALQLTPSSSYPKQTVLVGRARQGSEAPRSLRFAPLSPERARAILNELISLYWLARRIPLPFFPETSRKYVERLRTHQKEENPEERALEDAREEYCPVDQSFQQGEQQNPYVAKLFGDTDPLSPDFSPFPTSEAAAAALPSFVELAHRIYDPLLEAESEVGGPAS